MDIRAQTAVVFHLDKCIGCHTCSVACKNIWTDRKGAEYMWWNNVETKPGTGYPGKWEDQSIYNGGWVRDENGRIQLKGAGKKKGLLNIFHNPSLPTVEDYYEPFTYNYLNLIEAPPGTDQPTARPVSLITGEPIDVKMGPNWDDDLSGTPDYARNDPNLAALTPAEREAMFQLERMAFFYLPRICNHCLNPACVASCPSGAIYKRGEDGVVLINQKVCRAWRMCVTPACMHSCVGRIRYIGVILYDADKIEAVASAETKDLVARQLDLMCDPFDDKVIAAAKANGIADSTIKAAQQSPTYKFIKQWGMALPLHPEFRTLPMLWYVPPLLPVMASVTQTDGAQKDKLNPIAKTWTDNWLYDTSTEELWGTVEQARFPLKYLASLFAAGETGEISMRLKKLMAVRIYRRWKTVGDIPEAKMTKALKETGLTQESAEGIFYLTALAKFNDRFVIPAAHREQAMEMLEFTGDVKGSTGFGFRERPERGM
jgi:nitrate reductase beta subunit